jgi:uncharacterized protein YodC (DUF2158 family)
MDFEPGDVVQLKSGGPLMTVEVIDKDGMTGRDAVFCVWFEKVGNRQEVKRVDSAPFFSKNTNHVGL